MLISFNSPYPVHFTTIYRGVLYSLSIITRYQLGSKTRERHKSLQTSNEIIPQQTVIRSSRDAAIHTYIYIYIYIYRERERERFQ